MDDDLLIFGGNSNPALSQKISDKIDIRLGECKINRFSDGEIQIEILENVRMRDVFVIQSTCHPASDNLMELLLMIDALKRSSAKRITAVMPYFGYARQDKKVAPRVPISARMVADLLQVAGAHRIITMDLHAGQIQGFFNIPVDNLYSSVALIKWLRDLDEDTNNLIMVSPDAGGAERARGYAKVLGVGWAIVDKHRDKPNEAKAMSVIGDVEGKNAVIIDDMVDTAGTLRQASEAIMKKKAASVCACCTHPVLSGKAIKNIINSPLKGLITTDTIPLREDAVELIENKRLFVVSVAKLFGEAILRGHRGDSVSSLFE